MNTRVRDCSILTGSQSPPLLAAFTQSMEPSEHYYVYRIDAK